MEGYSNLGPALEELQDTENYCQFLFITIYNFSFTSQNFPTTLTLWL